MLTVQPRDKSMMINLVSWRHSDNNFDFEYNLMNSSLLSRVLAKITNLEDVSWTKCRTCWNCFFIFDSGDTVDAVQHWQRQLNILWTRWWRSYKLHQKDDTVGNSMIMLPRVRRQHDNILISEWNSSNNTITRSTSRCPCSSSLNWCRREKAFLHNNNLTIAMKRRSILEDSASFNVVYDKGIEIHRLFIHCRQGMPRIAAPSANVALLVSLSVHVSFGNTSCFSGQLGLFP